jgi:hypothetical protein
MPNNKWRWTYKDKDGQTYTQISRGPRSKQEMEKAAKQVMGAMTRSALRSGAEDPRLELVSIEPLGMDNSPVGAPLSPTAIPLDLHRHDKPAEATADTSTLQ